MEPAGGHAHAPAGVPAMRQAMEAMHDAMARAATTGDPDVDFLAAMIPHHQGAIDMARALLRDGRDPLVRRLAEEIIAAQQTEIDSMRARLAILQGGRDPDPGGFPALHGTRGPVPAPAPPARQ